MNKLSIVNRAVGRMGVSQESIDYLIEQIVKRDNKIKSLIDHIELMNKPSVPVDQRYLEVTQVDSATSKLTINPRSGRVSLKISHKASVEVSECLARLAESVKSCEDIYPLTMRGKITFLKGEYIVKLQTESKRFSREFRIKESNV